jgi:site-specific recombinase XerD
MSTQQEPETILHLDRVVAQKKLRTLAGLDDSFEAWIEIYLDMVVTGERSPAITHKIKLHLTRFRTWYMRRYGQDCLSLCLKSDVLVWLETLKQESTVEGEAHPPLSNATINNHLAILSGFCTWVERQRPRIFQMGNPCRGIDELPLPALRPDTLSEGQVASLKSTLARLPALYQRRGRRHVERQRKQRQVPALRQRSRPYRDRAIIELMLSTGVRREELVTLNLENIELSTHMSAPLTAEALRQARRVQLVEVAGKGQTLRNLWLSADARAALADYQEKERPIDAAHFGNPTALFLRAWNATAPRDPEEARVGRLANNTINHIVAHIGHLHDCPGPAILNRTTRRGSGSHGHKTEELDAGGVFASG